MDLQVQSKFLKEMTIKLLKKYFSNCFFFIIIYCWVWSLWRVIYILVFFPNLSWYCNFLYYKDFICETLYVIIVFIILEAFAMSLFNFVLRTAPSSFGLTHHFVVKISLLSIVIDARCHTAPSLFNLAQGISNFLKHLIKQL